MKRYPVHKITFLYINTSSIFFLRIKEIKFYGIYQQNERNPIINNINMNMCTVTQLILHVIAF